jgi:hypothetical protein
VGGGILTRERELGAPRASSLRRIMYKYDKISGVLKGGLIWQNTP